METVPVRRDGIIVVLKVPLYGDFTVSADVLRGRRGNVPARDWSNVDAFPAWFSGRKTTDIGVDPITDRAKCVVICTTC